MRNSMAREMEERMDTDMPEVFEPPDNPYIIDVIRGPEIVRLIHQSKFFVRAMGLFPEGLDLSGVTRLLDIGCGPGEWALTVAHAFPKMQVIGIDLDRGMTKYAEASAWSQGLENASFEVMDAKQPLDFEDDTFDLIHARFIVGFMDQASWPVLLSECFRTLAPGGRLLLREAEMGVSSSPALQQLSRYLMQALYEQHRTFSPDGYSLGITHRFGTLLNAAGFVQVQHRPFLLDASSDSDLYFDTFRDLELLFALLKPYVLASHVVEEAVYDEQYQHMIRDMIAPDFTSVSYGLQSWGVKPFPAEPVQTEKTFQSVPL